MSMTSKTYGDLYLRISTWIREDKILPQYKDVADNIMLNPLDYEIHDILGHKLTIETRPSTFIGDIADGKFNWIFGPHGLTLFKILLIKRGKM
jgi:hypothetical protein